LVVHDASVTHSSLGHQHRVDTSVGERAGPGASRLSGVDEAADGNLTLVLLLQLASLLPAQHDETPAGNSGKDNDADNNTGSNGRRIWR
jgi:hypothetical protein